jgi:hypothetical protein
VEAEVVAVTRTLKTAVSAVPEEVQLAVQEVKLLVLVETAAAVEHKRLVVQVVRVVLAAVLMAKQEKLTDDMKVATAAT